MFSAVVQFLGPFQILLLLLLLYVRSFVIFLLLKYDSLALKITFSNLMVVVCLLINMVAHCSSLTETRYLSLSIYITIYQCFHLSLPLILFSLSILLLNPPLMSRLLLNRIKTSLLTKKYFLFDTDDSVILV